MTRVRKHALLFALLPPALAPQLWAQGTYAAASCNQSDVNAVINGPTHTAVNGDTINIPSGSCTWTSGITVPGNIGITIMGYGTPQSGSSTTGASSSCSQTTITVSNGITAFRATPLYGNATTRLSCMNIASGSGSGVAASILGTCTSSGCPSLRLDNFTFSNWAGHANVGNSYGITAIGDMFGVVDHNTISGSSGNYLQLIEESNASYLGVGLYGDNTWALPEAYGSANFLFIENNLFNASGISDNEGSAGSLQNQGGGRMVARYNTFNLDTLNYAFAWHGTETAGRPRSNRAFEFYGNTMSCPSSIFCQAVIDARGGTGLAYANTMNFGSGSGIGSYIDFYTYRTQASINLWGPCDGSTVYDTNDGVTYYSGTVSSVSGSGPYTITVSGTPGWTTNQWFQSGTPYSVHDVTKSTGTEITANGSNTLTLAQGGGPGSWTPAMGDSIQILRATVCIDQAGGRGLGYLYSGSTPQATPADETPSPTYVWMNSFSGATPGTMVYSDTARVVQNRNYYTETANQPGQASATSPFDGSTSTTGIGHGTLALRPTSCTPSSSGAGEGTAYWETDHNQLDFCIGTNTWSTIASSPASYTPYTYPHPLETSGGNPPPTPSPDNLTATAH